MALSTDGVKGVGNVRIVPFQKTRALPMSVPLGLIIMGHLSMADQLNLVVLQGIPIQRNNDLTVEVDHAIVNADARANLSAYAFHHLPTFILLP